MQKINKWFMLPYAIWMLFFIIVPLCLLVYFSFIDIHGQFSFDNYRQIFSPTYGKLFLESIIYAVIITLLTLLISYPAAYFIRASAHQNVWLLVLIIPTWINLLLKTYAFIGILSQEGLANRLLSFLHLPKMDLLFTAPAFILVATYIYIPFMILPIFNNLKEIPNHLLDAATDLGANSWTRFRKIIFPLTKKGIFTGIQITFIPALSLFMITRLIAGNRVINIGTAIEEQFLVIQNYGMGSTIALFLVLFMAFILIVTNVKNDRRNG
ncbi:ABC transporter permease [Staphylococcus auricularis]|uniref:ABC transporter permease n=1 Tax=Staphylococcus auricularis TaxID=29379 RepID=UPI001EF19881|nr:ABC transporter permease [Staphylococcus auricularis]MCG7340453.1 ABC transporter permease [Staphylococcus auricularis]